MVKQVITKLTVVAGDTNPNNFSKHVFDILIRI